MIRESIFYKVLSVIHIVFFTSILCFGTIFLSGTLLLIPVLGAAFKIGKDAIYKKLDINDSVVKTYFMYLRSSLKLIKFIPVNIVMLLNVAGMLVAASNENLIYSVICLAIISFVLVFMLYIAGYYAFIDEQVSIIEVVISMFLKPHFLTPVFAIMVLGVFFFSEKLLTIMIFTGSFFLYVLEIVVFIQMLYYKKLLGKLDDNDEFAYLIRKRQTQRQRR